MRASPAQPAQAHPTIGSLIDEDTDWKAVLDRDRDAFGTISRLVTLYRFAITNYSNPFAEFLLNAIAAMEADADS